MKFRAVMLLLGCLLMASCGSEPHSNPGANVTGNWNAAFVVSGQTTPSYTIGLAFTMKAADINGTEIAYTGATTYNAECVNYGNLTATGNTNGGSLITLNVTDPSTGATFTVSGTADSAVTQINGTFSANFGSGAQCANTSGQVVLSRQ